MITTERRALPNPDETPTIPVDQTATILGVSPRNVYRGIESGEIPSIRVGRRIVVPTRKFLRQFGLLDEPATDIEAARLSA